MAAPTLGRSLSPDISRSIMAQLDSVGITAWRVDPAPVEQLATDQSSLKGGGRLAKPANMVRRRRTPGRRADLGRMRGLRRQSYRVMEPICATLGNKCTCPSRKFPCKHVLGLLWLNARRSCRSRPPTRRPGLSDWLGRRRGASAAKPASNAVAAQATPRTCAPHARPNREVAEGSQAMRHGARPQAARRNEENRAGHPRCAGCARAMDWRSAAHGLSRLHRRCDGTMPADRGATGRRQGRGARRPDRRVAGPPPRASARAIGRAAP